MVIHKVFTVKGADKVENIMTEVIDASNAVQAAVNHFNEVVSRVNNVTIEITEEEG